MYTIFFTISGMVVVLNLFFLLVPEGVFEKYITGFVGVLILVVSVTFFSGQKFQFDTFDFSTETEGVTEITEVSAVAVEQWIEGIASSKAKGEISVRVDLDGSEIEKIEIIAVPALLEEELAWIATQCDIEIAKFVLK